MDDAGVEILYTSSEILMRLLKLFGNPDKDDRRVALVAYVGGGARAFLAAPSGMRVICNPSPGGTSARVLRELIQAGAEVQLSLHLHSKVYWSEKRGCIVGSANASTNALGVGGLTETAVFLRPGVVDIDRLIVEACPKDVTEAALARLQKGTNKLPKKFQPESDVDSKEQGKSPDFTSWFTSAHRNSDPWKIAWWTDVGSTAKSAFARALTEYGVAEPVQHMNVASGTVNSNEWLLCYEIDNDWERVKKIGWQFVNFVVPVAASDKAAYEKKWPFQAIQVHALKKCPSPPFQITDKFRKAFREAVIDWGIEKLTEKHSLQVPDKLLKSIYSLMGIS